MSLKLLLRFRIEPYYKKTDEIWGAIGKTKYKIPVYRWEKFVSPTIKELGRSPCKAILERNETSS